MKPFLDQDFLLDSPTAQTLYREYAKEMPIVDYHCHVSPRDIYEDRHFANLYQAWLEGDHYKWRLMRWGGVDEEYITGGATEWEKFYAFAQVLPRAVGNPLYHWCHMELRRYFGYDGVLSPETAKQVWQLCEEKLAQPGMGVRGLIAQSKVAFVGTTDDPADTLEWHARLAQDASFQTVVAPSFRPDKALNIEKPGWREYIAALGDAAEMSVNSLEALQAALQKRMQAFAAAGCRASDHGLDYVPFHPGSAQQGSAQQAEEIFAKALAGAVVTQEEAELFKTGLLLFCGRCYARLGWVMQVHYNCLRNPNTAMMEKLGPDTGFDSVNTQSCTAQLAALLDTLYREDHLPRTILYSLNAGENTMLDALAGAFQGGGIPGRVQHGSAWWFNDTKAGITEQLEGFARTGLLGSFVGMLTDSRSFLSYTRHDYFRRILCNLVGGWAEAGEYPCDIPFLGGLVQDICCRNAVRFFNLEGVG